MKMADPRDEGIHYILGKTLVPMSQNYYECICNTVVQKRIFLFCDPIYWKTEPNCKSGKIKHTITPPADCHATVLLVSSLNLS